MGEKRERERGRNNLHHFFHFFPTQALHSRFLSELSVFIPICLRETVALVIVIILYIKSLVSHSALGNIIDSDYDEEDQIKN